MSTPRYHPAQVALHWFSAILLLFALAMGMLSLVKIPNADAMAKIFALKGHMALGIGIGVVMLIRLVLRFVLRQPPRASAGFAWLDRLAVIVHYGMYAAALGMAVSGMALALQTGLPDIVFGASGAPLPETFAGLAPRRAHGAFARLLLILVSLHVAGALFHQFVLRDRLLARMGFGGRT